MLIIFGLLIFKPVNASYENKLSCMYNSRCRNNVDLIENIDNIKTNFSNKNFDNIANEFNSLINNLNQFNVKVFLADKKYFPKKYIGVYNPKNNHIFLNKKYMNNNLQLIRTLRHEAWHVAQDCKTGLKNNNLGMILHLKYFPNFIDYERGAIIASRNKGMAEAALKSCFTNNDKYIINYLGKLK